MTALEIVDHRRVTCRRWQRDRAGSSSWSGRFTNKARQGRARPLGGVGEPAE